MAFSGQDGAVRGYVAIKPWHIREFGKMSRQTALVGGFVLLARGRKGVLLETHRSEGMSPWLYSVSY